ncbi:DJ-1/PfpI family protein [Myceligenerans indicum]|uniref:Thiamine biosynthesis protein ThiJ n=1 Tax=Myceligenerans indicum TaxID=2593663 RepID=A0ABS1LNX8_9MICO|nr:DJ-1/PfpI family protein [Myceligenerans indicum]MBL0887977.1 thiamine biosynthesis protein ThiJ [Myceligenerans indicum]
MSGRTIALYTTETMADWEYAYLTTQVAGAEAVWPGRFTLEFAGDGTDTVRSLGGLPVRPTTDLEALASDESLAALVIPGGDRYGQGHERLLDLVGVLLARDVPVAAICGATYLLARGGLLDTRRHTSNDASFLRMSGYQGGDHYVDAPVVTDQGITTASGLQAIPFTAAVARLTGLQPEPVVDAWEQLYDTRRPEHFYALREATREWQDA